MYARKGTHRPIDGILPKYDHEYNDNNPWENEDESPLLGLTYQRLNVKVPFTGRMQIAREFIEEYYVHMGFQKPSAFRTLLEFEFKDGKVISHKDLSENRKTPLGDFRRKYGSKDLISHIDDAFSLDAEDG